MSIQLAEAVIYRNIVKDHDCAIKTTDPDFKELVIGCKADTKRILVKHDEPIPYTERRLMELRYDLDKKRALVAYGEPGSNVHDLLGATQN